MQLSKGEVETIVQKTTLETLGALGFDVEDAEGRRELRADLLHLRRWRTVVDRTSSRALLTAVTLVVTGVLGWVWLAVSSAVHLRWPPGS